MRGREKPMIKRMVLSLLLSVVLALGALPAYAAGESIPPVPEWPIIGPLLTRLGIVQPVVESVRELTPGLREYRITSFDDMEALEAVEVGDRIRVIASDTDLNAMIREAMAENTERASATISFSANQADMQLVVSREYLDRVSRQWLPIFGSGDIEASASIRPGANACVAQFEIRQLRLNRFSLGLRFLAQRAVNIALRETWGDAVCVENIIVLPGEIAIEGYRMR